MARPPATVQDRLRAAKEAERAAARRVREASRARLTELLRLAPRERLTHLDDPALTGPDRVSLRRSIQAAFARPRRRWWPQGRLLARGRRLGVALLRGAFHPAVLVLLVIAGGWFELARRATPQVGRSVYPLTTILTRPDGSRMSYTFPVKTWVPVEHLEGDLAWVRVWDERQGYLYGAVWRSDFNLSPTR
ncbi:hypothetical protein [Methylobacterium sp. yr668]|uniref:hypothetical protein n=1 Tax=Methylobacterium sp. yr668 TaxID=1761801 RepID=UPI0008E6889F|nr:hypothetical protein [Methylobacterium sp. yr668]SFT26636.1 hypothetical protein SAMN04487845_13619 [Methylobacterium sp. yr668]